MTPIPGPQVSAAPAPADGLIRHSIRLLQRRPTASKTMTSVTHRVMKSSDEMWGTGSASAQISPAFVARAPRRRCGWPHGPKERFALAEGVADPSACALSKRLEGVRPVTAHGSASASQAVGEICALATVRDGGLHHRRPGRGGSLRAGAGPQLVRGSGRAHTIGAADPRELHARAGRDGAGRPEQDRKREGARCTWASSACRPRTRRTW